MFSNDYLKRLVNAAMEVDIREGETTLQVSCVSCQVTETDEEYVYFDADMEVKNSKGKVVLKQTLNFYIPNIQNSETRTSITLSQKRRCLYQGDGEISYSDLDSDDNNFTVWFDEDGKVEYISVGADKEAYYERKDLAQIDYTIPERARFKMKYVLLHLNFLDFNEEIPTKMNEEFLELLETYYQIPYQQVPETPADYLFQELEENLIAHIKSQKSLINRDTWNKWRGSSRNPGHQLYPASLQNSINRFFNMVNQINASATETLKLGKNSLQTSMMTNPASALSQGRKIYFYNPTNNETLRVYNNSFIGILDPTKTAEGPNINKYNELSRASKIEGTNIYINLVDKNGNKVKLTYFEFSQKRILAVTSWNFQTNKEVFDKENKLVVLLMGYYRKVNSGEWDYHWESDDAQFSINTSLTPFLNMADHTRGILGAHMEDQAIPCVGSRPMPVYTEEHLRVYKESGMKELFKDESGTITELTDDYMVIKLDKPVKEETATEDIEVTERTIFKPEAIQSLAHTFNCYKTHDGLKVGSKVKKDDTLYEVNSFHDNEYSISVPTLVGITSYHAREFEDAQVVRKGYAHNFGHKMEHKIRIDLPWSNYFILEKGKEDKNSPLDAFGVIKEGQVVHGGDKLISIKKYLFAEESKIAATMTRLGLSEDELIVDWEKYLPKSIKEGTVKKVLFYKHQDFDDYNEFSEYYGLKMLNRKDIPLERKDSTMFESDEDELYATFEIWVDEIKELNPGGGDKLTNYYGGKGTINSLPDDDKMFRTESGELVDMIVQSQTDFTRKIGSMEKEGTLNRICQILFRQVQKEGWNTDRIACCKLLYPDMDISDEKDCQKIYNRDKKYGFFRRKVSIYDNRFPMENIEKMFTLLGMRPDGAEYLIDPVTGHKQDYPTRLLYLGINRLFFFPDAKAKATAEKDLTDGQNLVFGVGQQRADGQKIGIQETMARLANGISETLKSTRDTKISKSKYIGAWMLLNYTPGK